MYIIGLTGGIGSGKSTASQLFEKLGVGVIDADQIAHRISEPGQPGYQAITALFGADVLQPNGQIDRRKLRDIVFNDDLQRQQLESNLHPLIRREMLHQAELVSSPYCMLSIPLLTESNNLDGIDRTLVIDCPEATQLERACIRDQMTIEQAEKIMAAQNSRDERLSYADDVILNDGDIAQLKTDVEALHNLYLMLAATHQS